MPVLQAPANGEYTLRERILAHRGFWFEPSEKNSVLAFERAFENGFGVETDIRDLDGELVISHDPPISKNAPLRFSEFLKLYVAANSSAWLALNIKADGLSGQVLKELQAYGVKNAFVFDMSVPDMRGYLKAGAITFTRKSDVETQPSYYETSAGVWLDCFEIPYSPMEWVEEVVKDGKYAAIVSPELHGRGYQDAWASLKSKFNPATEEKVMICTDLPSDALDYFQS